jgi:crotonobetainyl-CoA:carnitine CoA-transferase CaiB-like acyl-CoA transferase
LDRPIAIAVGSERLWCAFCRAIERPELAAHPDYDSNAARIRNRVVLEPMLQEVFAQRPIAEWLERLQAAGIPASAVRNFEEVVADPQSDVREMFPWLEHPAAGRHRVTGTPVKLSETPGTPGLPAPGLGEHSAAALQELLGLASAEVTALMDSGVIFTAER